jgi:hypothetical protein
MIRPCVTLFRRRSATMHRRRSHDARTYTILSKFSLKRVRA